MFQATNILFVDDRLTVEEWLELTEGPDVKLQSLAISGNDLIATVAYPGTIFPSRNIRIRDIQIPEDVTFNLEQVR